MTTPSQLTWDNFRATIVVPGQKRLHRVSTVPSIEIYSDAEAGKLGLLIECDQNATLPAVLSELSIVKSSFRVKGKLAYLDVWTEQTVLHRQFYHFAVAVADRMLAEQTSAIEAVALEVQCFGDLLQEQSRLSIERQIGLLGELKFLERLIERHGAGAVDAWLGPLGEPHDFRIGKREFEVKTTLLTQRVHIIHGVEQLVPSQGCSLFLVSVLVGPPGKSVGFSLPDMVGSVRQRLAQTGHAQGQFLAALEKGGYVTAEASLYARRYALRRPLAVVPVDGACPALTRSGIQSALGETSARIGTVQYEVNVDGLEKVDGSEYFEAALLPPDSL